MDEQGPPSTDERSARETPGVRRASLGAVALVVVGVALAGFAAIWFLSIASPAPATCACAQPAALPSTANWQVYHDALGLFIVRLPPGWKASVSLGSYSQSGPNGNDSGQSEDISFSNPSLGAASPSLYVFAQQSHDDSLNCVPRSRETSSFNGYPADTSMQAVIFFESKTAHFQLDETVPGVLAPINPGGPINPPTAQPAPPVATVTTERALLTAMLASFQPTASPLACG